MDNGEDDIGVESSKFSIRRYDSVGSFSQEDQKRLRGIYTLELDLPEHPLYDLYFSQIYHAQAIGLTVDTNLPRRTVSLEDETFNVLSKWKGKARLEEESNIVQATREFLRWFITTYLKSEWQSVALSASIELSVAGILTGSLTGTLPVTLITLTGGEILKAVVVAPPHILPEEYKPIVFGAVFSLMICCLLLLVRPTWFRQPSPQLTQTNSPQAPPTLIPFLPNSTVTTAVISTHTITPTLNQIVVSTLILPTASSILNTSPNYCLYVVQPEDTI